MIRLLLILALVASPALAQDTTIYGNCANPDGCLTLGRGWTFKPSDYVVGNGLIATVKADGEVKIDWDAVEKAVNNPDATDAHTLAIARLMIAIVYGTWKPMK